jgi:hypothetical protein
MDAFLGERDGEAYVGLEATEQQASRRSWSFMSVMAVAASDE